MSAADLVDLVANDDRETTVFRLRLQQFSRRQLPIDRRLLATLIEQTFVPHLADARVRIDRSTPRWPTISRSWPRRRSTSDCASRAGGCAPKDCAAARWTFCAKRIAVEKASLDVLKALRTVQQTFAIHL